MLACTTRSSQGPSYLNAPQGPSCLSGPTQARALCHVFTPVQVGRGGRGVMSSILCWRVQSLVEWLTKLPQLPLTTMMTFGPPRLCCGQPGHAVSARSGHEVSHMDHMVSQRSWHGSAAWQVSPCARLCVRAVLRPRISILTKSCPRRFRRQQVYTPSTVVPMGMQTGFRGLFAAFVANHRI